MAFEVAERQERQSDRPALVASKYPLPEIVDLFVCWLINVPEKR